jgi:hypothetical protein
MALQHEEKPFVRRKRVVIPLITIMFPRSSQMGMAIKFLRE